LVEFDMPAIDQPREEESFDALLERLKPRLKQILYRYQIPPEDAEDILQEALLATVLKWERIRSPEAWLVVTLKNRCLIYWRRRRGSLCSAVDDAALELLSEPEEPPQERQHMQWDLDHLLGSLPARHQDLLRLRYLEGHSPSEVAAQLGYRQSSVRKLASRCLARLSEQAEDKLPS
jgi:RNA polymerase sigma-70 factor (ECF subfamily)